MKEHPAQNRKKYRGSERVGGRTHWQFNGGWQLTRDLYRSHVEGIVELAGNKEPFYKGFMSSWCKNMCCFDVRYYDQISSQFCTCHDSWAVVACTKLGADWVIGLIRITVSDKRNFTRFHWRAHKQFVRCGSRAHYNAFASSYKKLLWITIVFPDALKRSV